jgi:hypothetical protein
MLSSHVDSTKASADSDKHLSLRTDSSSSVKDAFGHRTRIVGSLILLSPHVDAVVALRSS